MCGGGGGKTPKRAYFPRRLWKSEVGQEKSNGRSKPGRRDSFTLTASLETLAFFSLSLPPRGSLTVQQNNPAGKGAAAAAVYDCWRILTGVSVRICSFCLQTNAPLRLREPTEAMRLPQMNTCYSAPHRLCWRERKRER